MKRVVTIVLLFLGVNFCFSQISQYRALKSAKTNTPRAGNPNNKAQKTISVLIVDGFSNHDWIQTTAVIKWLLEKSGRFRVDVSTVPTDSLQLKNWRPAFNNY